MPKLDEGALWVRATMPYTISFDESSRIVPEIRAVLHSFPEVTVVADEHGRPDDGTDPTGFFNAEFYVGLKPYGEWTGPYHSKAALIDAINRKLQVFPGITFNYTQPAEDAVDEAETGLKSSLDVKVFGPDLAVLEEHGKQIKHIMERVHGITETTLVQELGQPALTVDIDRDKIARYGINVADVNGLIEAAVGGQAATQVVQGEKLFDLIVRLQPQFRETPQAIGNILVATPAGQQIPIRDLATIRISTGAAFIYRQDNSRYIGIQYSVEGRDLASAVQEAQARRGSRGQVATGVPRRVGRRVPGIHGVARRAPDCASGDARSHPGGALRALPALLVSTPHCAGRPAVRTDRRGPRARDHADPSLRIIGHRVSCALWRLGTNGGCVHLVRERAATRRRVHRGGDAAGRIAAAPSDRDDGAGRCARLAAGGPGNRRRHGHPAPVCAGHRRRPLLAALDQCLPHARPLRDGRATGRLPGGLRAERRVWGGVWGLGLLQLTFVLRSHIACLPLKCSDLRDTFAPILGDARRRSGGLVITSARPVRHLQLREPIIMKRREFLVSSALGSAGFATSALGTVGLSRSALAELVKAPRAAAGTRKVLIAGGGFNTPFIRYMATLTGKQRPRICYLPTASADRPEGSIAFFKDCAPVDVEPFVQESFISSYRQTQGWDDVLLSMDGIVASGGNTLNQQAIWKAQGIDTVL